MSPKGLTMSGFQVIPVPPTCNNSNTFLHIHSTPKTDFKSFFQAHFFKVTKNSKKSESQIKHTHQQNNRHHFKSSHNLITHT
jgi:hypothetical protein